MPDVRRPSRSETLAEFFDTAEVLCRESECLTARIDDLQSALWMELTSLRDQIGELDDVQRRLHALLSDIEQGEADDVACEPR